MTFPVAIIFLVLLLWFAVCLPLLGLYYLEGNLGKVYDMVILLSLCASMFLTLLSLMLVFIIEIYKE